MLLARIPTLLLTFYFLLTSVSPEFLRFSFAFACDDNATVFDTLPGKGFDSLQNKEMASVFHFGHDSCETTSDKMYRIPDNIDVIPNRDSQLMFEREMIRHYGNYTNVDAKSFSFSLGIDLGYVDKMFPSLFGAFSDGYRNMKHDQLEGKGLMTRISARYTLYEASVNPEAKLTPNLQHLLTMAINEMKSGNTTNVRCMMEFILRDYGTHYVKSVKTGGVLVKEDFISSQLLEHDFNNENDLMIAAHASFLGKFQFGAEHLSIVDDYKKEQYDGKLTKTTHHAIGGDLLSPNTMIDDWVKTIPKKMAIIDRVGDPLYYLMDKTYFPSVDIELLHKMQKEFKAVTADYFKHNIHEGCMEIWSPNFDHNANVAGGNCVRPKTNYRFGGLFQTCTPTNANRCKDFNRMNPLTGELSCPSGYAAMELVRRTDSVEKTGQSCPEKCSGWWIFKSCKENCHDYTYHEKLTFTSYWCVANEVPSNNGYMFGGLYTRDMNNLVTNSRTCPPFYSKLEMWNDDATVCVSNDYSVGFPTSIPFGGFFSCRSVNPFADNARACPDGYTQLKVAIIGECEVKFCFISRKNNLEDIALKSPPFADLTENHMFTSIRDCYTEEQSTSTNSAIPEVQKDGKSFEIILICSVAAVCLLLFTILIVLYVKGWTYFSSENVKLQWDKCRKGFVDYVAVPTSNGCGHSKDFVSEKIISPMGTFAVNLMEGTKTNVVQPGLAYSKSAWDRTSEFSKKNVAVPVLMCSKMAWEKSSSFTVEVAKNGWRFTHKSGRFIVDWVFTPMGNFFVVNYNKCPTFFTTRLCRKEKKIDTDDFATSLVQRDEFSSLVVDVEPTSVRDFSDDYVYIDPQSNSVVMDGGTRVDISETKSTTETIAASVIEGKVAKLIDTALIQAAPEILILKTQQKEEDILSKESDFIIPTRNVNSPTDDDKAPLLEYSTRDANDVIGWAAILPIGQELDIRS